MSNNKPSPSVLSTGSVSSEVSMLFRTKRVSEIRTIESQIRAEASDKSESLRQLLGTRYKDLITATEKMHSMHETCSISVRDALRNMATSASDIRQQFLSKRSTPSPVPIADDLERRKNVHVVGSTLKHIVDTPEMLYAHLEAGHIYRAAERYYLAAENYRKLTTTPGIEGVASRFAERRWKQVEVFKPQILQSAQSMLITPDKDHTSYSSAFASLLVLAEEKCQILPILDGMLASRTAWIDDENSKRDSSVSVRIRGIAQIVRECISCASSMFWTEGSGIEKFLENVDTEAVADLKRLREDGSLRNAYLSWIKSVEEWLSEHGKSILSSANTSRALADTLVALSDVFSGEDWLTECSAVLGKPPSFVFDIFRPFISERAAKVASESVQRAVDTVLSGIEEVWSDMTASTHAGKLIWSTVSSQAVGWNYFAIESEAFVLRTKSPANEERDVARTLASSGQASSVVNSFENSLQEALSDVTILKQRIPSVSTAFGESVQLSLPRILQNLQTRLESIPTQVSDDSASKSNPYEQILEQSLFVARTATSLGTASCVRSAYQFGMVDTAEALGTQPSGVSSIENTALGEFCDNAEKVSRAGYKVWANRVCIALARELYNNLTSEAVLNIPMGWNSKNVSSNSSVMEDGEYAPGHPTAASTALIKFLSGACNSSNRAGGFALPHSAIQFLREEMVLAAITSYSKAHYFYCGHDISAGDEKLEHHEPSEIAITQLLFDFSLLQLLVGNASTAKAPNSTESLKSVEQKIESSIDPINLAAGRKALQESVSSYASRISILFGTIMRASDGSANASKRLPTTSSQNTTSNLVSLARTVPRFTYLPAPMPSTYSTVGGTVGLNAKATLGLLRTEASSDAGSSYRKREDTSVAGYASKVSESVGRFGRGFFESLTRKVG